MYFTHKKFWNFGIKCILPEKLYFTKRGAFSQKVHLNSNLVHGLGDCPKTSRIRVKQKDHLKTKQT